MPRRLFETAPRSLGYHPFPQPSANASAAYTNPEGATMGECVYCGFCERFGCESNAKASPNVNCSRSCCPIRNSSCAPMPM